MSIIPCVFTHLCLEEALNPHTCTCICTPPLKNDFYFKNLLHFQKPFVIIVERSANGPLVKRLRRRPLTAKAWVRFPYGSPNGDFSNHLTKGLENHKQKRRVASNRKWLSVFVFLLVYNPLAFSCAL